MSRLGRKFLYSYICCSVRMLTSTDCIVCNWQMCYDLMTEKTIMKCQTEIKWLEYVGLLDNRNAAHHYVLLEDTRVINFSDKAKNLVNSFGYIAEA